MSRSCSVLSACSFFLLFATLELLLGQFWNALLLTRSFESTRSYPSYFFLAVAGTTDFERTPFSALSATCFLSASFCCFRASTSSSSSLMYSTFTAALPKAWSAASIELNCCFVGYLAKSEGFSPSCTGFGRSFKRGEIDLTCSDLHFSLEPAWPQSQSPSFCFRTLASDSRTLTSAFRFWMQRSPRASGSCACFIESSQFTWPCLVMGPDLLVRIILNKLWTTISR